ncbi:MAG: DUF1446 domain-containing protein [Actinomycetota bacterium]|nr:DUF1446 domain-containing protein [Actinomycetota bacterium]
MSRKSVRVGNFSGFYGDRSDALDALLEGEVDFVTGDFLAELTMSILNKAKQKDQSQGYARTLLPQLHRNLSKLAERGIKVVTNAGGVAPRALAELLNKTIADLGYKLKVALVDGDDLLGARNSALEELRHLDVGSKIDLDGKEVIAANCYLGAFGIARALDLGADIVITGRVTDAALAMGPAISYHHWGRDDYDQLAGALVAGHIIECGSQACGGNYSFLDEVKDEGLFGLPIAEILSDGSSIITKSANSGGLVSIGTITSQLLYEIGSPFYLNPDVIADFRTIDITETAVNEVTVSKVKGYPPTEDLKVSLLVDGGYKNSMTAVITGLDPEKKAELLIKHLKLKIDLSQFDSFETQFLPGAKANPQSNEEANSYLKISVTSSSEGLAGRTFSNSIVELALSNYAGFHATTPPTPATRFDRYIPALINRQLTTETMSFIGSVNVSETIGHPLDFSTISDLMDLEAEEGSVKVGFEGGVDDNDFVTAPLGSIVGARSGDKGGDCNIGLFTKSRESYDWLANFLTVERFSKLFPDFGNFKIERHRLDNIFALNFVIHGLLGEGVSSSNRSDPQAKGAGEYVRSRLVAIPSMLLK